MKYFEYSSFFLVFAGCLLLIFNFFKRLRTQHFYRLVFRALIKKNEPRKSGGYFSGYYLYEVVSFLIADGSDNARHALVYLCAGRISPAVSYLQECGQYFFAAVLKAFGAPDKAVEDFELLMKKKNAPQENLWGELMCLYSYTGRKARLQLALERFNEKKAAPYAKARYFYYRSIAGIENGDLLSASVDCSAAIKIFRKQKAYYEEAQAHVLMGILYRLSTIADVSQFMFSTAAKIFNALGASADEADVYANLGMLMSMQNRFDEADDYYLKGLELNRQTKRKTSGAQIINHRGLNAFLKKDLAAAQKFIKTALKEHEKLGNTGGIAFSKEILGNIFFAKKDYKQSSLLAEEAKRIYDKEKNTAAFLECSYLQSLSLFELGALKDAETILREIVSVSKNNPTCFHCANAYNLLGLIYMQQNDLRRAKGFFQQSLDLEQINNRLSGIATDYANISLIELRKGNKEQAEKTLKTALEYAEVNEDADLAVLLKQRLSQISES